MRAAADLLAEGDRTAVSTRAVAAAAGVHAPTIYRLFGDMRGLLDAVASYDFSTYLQVKTAREREVDPVEDLRRGWVLHVGFGLANPALYSLIYAEPHPGASSPAAVAAAELLAGQIRRIAEGGGLRVGEERAAHLVHAADCGTTLTLIALPVNRRCPTWLVRPSSPRSSPTPLDWPRPTRSAPRSPSAPSCHKPPP